jgi:hypothetical protein
MGELEESELRLQVADLLDLIAAQPCWSDELWLRFEALLNCTHNRGLLSHAQEELIHYSGEFNSRNLLLIPVKPNAARVSEHKEELRQIADALRSGTTWDEYKQVNNIYERGDGLARLFRGFRKHPK